MAIGSTSVEMNTVSSVSDKSVKWMNKLDLYRRIPKDLTEPTCSGATLSLFAVLVAVYLFYTELTSYLTLHRTSEMFVHDSNHSSHNDNKMQINLDITFHKLPCELMTFDSHDVMGNHELGQAGSQVSNLISSDLFKERLNSEGVKIEGQAKEELKPSYTGFNHFGGSVQFARPDEAKMRKAVDDKEGCRIFGFIKVNRVPGNFHLSTHTFGHIFANGNPFHPRQQNQNQTRNPLDISHTVNHLSFGDDNDINLVKSRFSKAGIISPLDGVKSAPSPPLEDANRPHSVIYEYYTKIVPTSYEQLNGKQTSIYQFTANSNIVNNGVMPGFYLRYDISPVMVLYKEHREDFSHFLVKVCAIIGGIFTVIGLLDSVVHQSVRHLIKKAQINKLG